MHDSQEMTLEQREFHLEEWKRLTSQIAEQSAQRKRIEEIAVIATVAVFSWLLTHPAPEGKQYLIALGWWLPLPLAIYGFMRHEAMIKTIDTNADYIKKLEANLADPKIGGWEYYLESRSTKTRFGRPLLRPMRLTSRVFWIALILFDVGVALWNR